jgi:Glycosyl hydrolases family 16
VKRYLLAAAVLVACLAAGPAVADQLSARGPNNAASSSLLDSGSVGHGPRSRPAVVRNPRASVPGPIAGKGYTKRFHHEFNSLNRRVWAVRQWWEERPPANSIYIRNGILHVVSRRSQGYPNVTATSEPHGRKTGRSFLFGYFEARLKWTKGNGSWPAFWLFSTAHATNPRWPQPACPRPTCLSAELDVFEGQGSEPEVFVGTIHRNSCDCYQVPNKQSENNSRRVGADLTGAFHVYGMLWTTTEIRWYLDGRFLMRAPVYDSTNQRMHLLLYMWTGGWTVGTDRTTPDELHTEVDWVKVWQK